MKVLVKRSFSGRTPEGKRVRACEGDIIDLPVGVDWLKAGLVAPVRPEPDIKPPKPEPKKAVSRRSANREKR